MQFFKWKNSKKASDVKCFVCKKLISFCFAKNESKNRDFNRAVGSKTSNTISGRFSRCHLLNQTSERYRRYPLIRTRKHKCAYQGVRNVRFSENLVCFVYLKHRFAIRPFALLPTNWFIKVKNIAFLIFNNCKKISKY